MKTSLIKRNKSWVLIQRYTEFRFFRKGFENSVSTTLYLIFLGKCFSCFTIRPKKSSLVSRNRSGEKNHSPARIVECVSEYTFFLSRNKKQRKKQQSRKLKETKEEKRISLENYLKKWIWDIRTKYGIHNSPQSLDIG